MYDVIIIGAGPSGSTAGYLLAEKGLEVLVIDKESFPRQKLCGGLISWKTRKLVEELYKRKFDDLFSIENISNDFYAFEKSKIIAYQPSPEPFYFVDRKNYDFELISLAEGKNCSFLLNEKVIDFNIRDATIITNKKELKGRIIIGADGVNSIIRRKVFPKSDYKHNLAGAFQIEFPRDKIKPIYSQLSPKLFFGVVKYGYGWTFPRKDTLAVGLGGLLRKNKNLKNKFIHFVNEVTKVKIGDKLLYKTNALPFGNFLEIPGISNVLLIGDSAGFVDPFTAEGIYYAQKSAEFASNAVLDFFNSSFRSDLVHSYRNYLIPIYNELKMAKKFRDIMLSDFRHIAYLFIRNPYAYYKFAKIIHGVKSYSRIPFLSKLV